MRRPVFGTALARSGGGLYTGMLSTNNDIMLANCPYMPLFRSFRNAVIRSLDDPAPTAAIPPSAPFQDYYFADARLDAFDAIQKASIDIPFDQTEWEELLEQCRARGQHDCADLTPFYDRLRGISYLEIFRNALNIIARTRDCNSRRWVGFHDVWVVEFYPALARAFPDARFVINLRDPRAIINSTLGGARLWPEQVGQVLSYARHWRKYVTLAARYAEDPLFDGRLFVTSHEAVTTRPREAASALCSFLEVDLDERMLDPKHYIDYSTNTMWQGNSSFEESTTGISTRPASRWRSTLDPAIVAAIEFLCGPEMALAGFDALTRGAQIEVEPDAAALIYLIRADKSYANWRSDLGDPQIDLGYELFRRKLMALPDDFDDPKLVRRSFLFPEIRRQLREGKQLPVFANV
jgi:Sulfotransferase family